MHTNKIFFKIKKNFCFSQENIQEKAKKLLEEIKESMNKDEEKFGMSQLNNLRSIADELEHHTCQHIMRYIFQESMEIERYPQIFRERFDIAFSQAVIILMFSFYKRLYSCFFFRIFLFQLTCLIFSIYVLLSSVKISDQAWKLYINNGECIKMHERQKREQKVYYAVVSFQIFFFKRKIERWRCFFNLIVNILFLSSVFLLQTHTHQPT
jgi:hypothetical protein